MANAMSKSMDTPICYIDLLDIYKPLTLSFGIIWIFECIVAFLSHKLNKQYASGVATT